MVIQQLPTRRVGIILAAGFGSRLRGASDETSLKPLTPVAGRPLMLRALDSLQLAGCHRAVIVVGHGAEQIEAAVRARYDGAMPIEFARNDDFDKSNGLSVLAAREHAGTEFVLMMADHVVDERLMAVARAHRPVEGGASLLVDRKLDKIFDMDDATKVRTDGDRIVEIGKMIDEYDCVDTGVFVCTDGLMDALDEVYAQRGDASLSDGVQRLSDAGTMRVVDVGDGYWQDVDTPEMLREAERMLTALADTGAIPAVDAPLPSAASA